LLNLPAWPLADITVSVHETQTGSLLFGVGAEVGRTGTVTVTTERLLPPVPEPLPVPKPMPADPARVAERTVQMGVLVAEVDRTAARKLKLAPGAAGKSPGWVVEVADEDRSRALQAGLDGLRENGHLKVVTSPQI